MIYIEEESTDKVWRLLSVWVKSRSTCRTFFRHVRHVLQNGMACIFLFEVNTFHNCCCPAKAGSRLNDLWSHAEGQTFWPLGQAWSRLWDASQLHTCHWNWSCLGKERGESGTMRRWEKLEKKAACVSNTTANPVTGIAHGNDEVMDKVLEMKEQSRSAA